MVSCMNMSIRTVLYQMHNTDLYCDDCHYHDIQQKKKKKKFLDFLYIVIHTNVILVQATTLSVAVNSYSKALLTIMISNNFVELKGSVFKKFEINNLFQMSCSGKCREVLLGYVMNVLTSRYPGKISLCDLDVCDCHT